MVVVSWFKLSVISVISVAIHHLLCYYWENSRIHHWDMGRHVTSFPLVFLFSRGALSRPLWCYFCGCENMAFWRWLTCRTANTHIMVVSLRHQWCCCELSGSDHCTDSRSSPTLLHRYNMPESSILLFSFGTREWWRSSSVITPLIALLKTGTASSFTQYRIPRKREFWITIKGFTILLWVAQINFN